MTNRKIKFFAATVLMSFDDAVLQAVTRLTIAGRLSFSVGDVQRMLPEKAQEKDVNRRNDQLLAIDKAIDALSGVTVRIEEDNRQFAYETTCPLLEIKRFVQTEDGLQYELAAAPVIGTLGLMS